MREKQLNNEKMKKLKIILSGGGTGGHIYPAIAVAEALKRQLNEQCEILFVGAQGKMEMERVPAYGYPIKGLPVAGLQRRLTWRNLQLPFRLLASLRRAHSIVRRFEADVVVGFGGYASGPVLWCAQRMGIPTLLQEQNSFAGLTNRILAGGAERICVAYPGMERFFPEERITQTGNPLRGSFAPKTSVSDEALEYFGLKRGKPTVLMVGGSLGTRTLNEAMKSNIDEIQRSGDFQVIWQTGSYYAREVVEFLAERSLEGIWVGAYIERMDLAYEAADVVVSRSGAGSVSELCLMGKPTLFVPSPNVAEDHQTKNAQALVQAGAAELIRDADVPQHLFPALRALLENPERRAAMRERMLELGVPDAADRVASAVIELAQRGKNKRKRNQKKAQ